MGVEADNREVRPVGGDAALGTLRHRVPEIARKLTIKSGKNAGKPPSVASLYRALAEVADSDALAGEALSLRPVPARITGPGSGTDPALMERLQRQGNDRRG